MCIYLNDEMGFCCKDQGITFDGSKNNKRCLDWREPCPDKITVVDVKNLQLRLAKADALCIKLAHQKGGQVDEIRGLKARLAEAEKLAKKWREEGQPQWSSYGQSIAMDCARELEAALRKEAEG